MKKEVIVEKTLNRDNREIVKSIEITKRSDSYNPETDYESVFYYRVSKESKVFFNDEGYAKFKFRHGNSLDYEDYHKNIVPLDWALSTLGYDTIKDGDVWVKRLREDDEFASELTKRILYLIPISKQEYEDGINE